MLVSFYNRHHLRYNVSGDRDPSASLYHVKRGLWLLKLICKFNPNAFRFIADDEGNILYYSLRASIQSLVEKDNHFKIKQDKMQFLSLVATPVTAFHFVMNYRA